MAKPDLEFLRSLHPYDELSPDALDKLVAQSECIDFPTESRIYELGDKLAGLYIIVSGHIEITDAIGDTISVLGRGNSFGERGLLVDGTAVTNANARDDATIILIPADVFGKLANDQDAVRRFFDRKRRTRAAILDSDDLATSRLADVMTKSVITVEPQTTVADAAERMNAANIAALVVTDDDQVAGIVSLRDLMKAALSGQANGVVADVMVRDIISLSSSDLAIDAILAMTESRVGHLPIIDGGRLVGIVTKSNLLSQGTNSVMAVIAGIGRVDDATQMRAHVDKLPSLLAQLTGVGVAPHIVTRLLTDIADAVTRRLIVLYREAHGEAPARYVFGALGSQGRQEQTGVSDQDNCIIYDDAVTDPGYFKGLAKFVSDGLDGVGYFYCPGSMMATTPKWCQPVRVWKQYFTDWIVKPTEEAQVLASVMFDLRAISGDTQMLDDLRVQVLRDASENSIFQNFLISNSLTRQPPLSLFRGLSTITSGEHKNAIDMKLNGVVPVVDIARIYAIQSQSLAANTRARLEAAIENGILSSSGGSDLIAAYDVIAEARLRHQMEQIRQGQQPDNFLEPATLTELERSHLRDAFVVVKSYQSALRRQQA